MNIIIYSTLYDKIENGVNICTSTKCFKIIKRTILDSATIHDRYLFENKTVFFFKYIQE